MIGTPSGRGSSWPSVLARLLKSAATWGFTKDRRQKRLGRRGERLARLFLERKGYRLLDRNAADTRGEIDLVMEADDATIVFVEVKTRRSDEGWRGEHAITPAKKRKLRATAYRMARRRRWLERSLRIDVIAIACPDEGKPVIRHYVNAVQAGG